MGGMNSHMSLEQRGYGEMDWTKGQRLLVQARVLASLVSPWLDLLYKIHNQPLVMLLSINVSYLLPSITKCKCPKHNTHEPGLLVDTQCAESLEFACQLKNCPAKFHQRHGFFWCKPLHVLNYTGLFYSLWIICPYHIIYQHRVTFSMWHAGASRKSSNDALRETLSRRLSRPISVPLQTAVLGTCGVPAPFQTAVLGTCGVPAPFLTAVLGTCGVSAPFLTAVLDTCGVPAPFLIAVLGTCGVPAPLQTAVLGTCGVPAPLQTAVLSWRNEEEEEDISATCWWST